MGVGGNATLAPVFEDVMMASMTCCTPSANWPVIAGLVLLCTA